MSRKLIALPALAFLALSGLLLTGCTRTAPPPPVASAPDPAVHDEHAHQAGGHGGGIVPVGRDSYHAEAVFEKGGAVRLFMLGKDETRVQQVEVQELSAHVRADGAAESEPLSFRAAPQTTDGAGMTSQFVAALPEALLGKSVEVVIPSLRVGGERFRVLLRSEAAAPHDEGRPTKVTDAAETKLYLTPAGKYTTADIEANGRQTASQKFEGQMAAHNMKPQPGDKVCPITQTKANAKFSWVVDSKTYEFCCPPCVDEFVQKAKQHPEEIGDPSDYIKK